MQKLESMLFGLWILLGTFSCGAAQETATGAENLPLKMPELPLIEEEPENLRDPLEYFSLPEGAFDHFFAAMDQAKPGQPAKILHYGDSHSASGWFGTALVEALAPAWKHSPGYASVKYPLDLGFSIQKEGQWTTDNWLYRKAVGPFGPFGVAFTSKNKNSAMTLKMNAGERNRTLSCFYDRTMPHAPFVIRMGQRTLAHSEMSREFDGEALGILRTTVPKGTTSLSLELDCPKRNCPAPLRFYGCLLQDEDAQIEIDILAVGGTTIQNPLRRSGPEQLEYVAYRKPDLLSIWFGTNNTGEPDFDPEKYKASQIALVERLREAAPESDCLIIGLPDRSKRSETCFLNEQERKINEKPSKKRTKKEKAILSEHRSDRICDPDRLVKFKGRKNIYPVESVQTPLDWEVYKNKCEWYTMPIVQVISRIQREVALSQGCGFFDTYAAMGGEASIARWACENPPRARLDMVHLSKDGYRELANWLAQGMAEKARERH